MAEIAAMFTGIIESLGRVIEVTVHGTNKTFIIQSPLSPALKVDQSLSHNGVCLTVEEIKDQAHRVTAVEETILKTNTGGWKPGEAINLERCLPMNGRLDGHIVQGHVDTTGTVLAIETLEGSWEFTIGFPEEFAPLIINKGSISLNGISLTVFDVTKTSFRVAIIPYTYLNTNMRDLATGDLVNLEFDMIGKYVNRLINLKS